MFQFRRFPSCTYFIQCRIPFGGFPHSEISGSMLICSSPKLIAAYHVLHRLLMPRHSPCALYSLTLVEHLLLKSCPLFVMNYAGFSCYYTQNCFVTLTRTAFAILLINSFHNIFAVDNLCCLLSLSQFFLFVQFSRCTLRLKPDINPQSLKGLYPSSSASVFRSGGPKWTRTTDLTIISRVL